MYFWKIVMIFMALLWVNCAIAQTLITVTDRKDSGALPYAHITYGDLAQKEKHTKVANENGIVSIPISFTERHERYTIQIKYIGYKTIIDTLDNKMDERSFAMQADQIVLNEVVVTGQYSPNSPEKAVQKIKIIDEKKIEQMAAVNLRDVLTNELNIRISQDNILGSGMSMQGISGQNVKIMIDGVPIIGRLDGNIDLSQINLFDIERIEIIEGPMSVSYGTDALAGTINLITKKSSKNKVAGSITSYNENIGTYNVLGGISFNHKKHHIRLSGGRNYFDGWHPDDRFFPSFGELRSDSSRYKQWKPKTQYFGRAQYSVSHKKMEYGYKAEYFDEEIINRGFPRSPYFETAFDDYYYTQRFDNSVFANGKITPQYQLNFVASFNHYQRIKNTYVKDLTTLDETLTTSPGAQDTSAFQMWMSRASITRSLDSVKLNYELGYDISIENAIGVRIEDEHKQMGNYALFTSAEYKPISNLTMRPGLRYTYNTAYNAPLIPSFHLRYAYNNTTLRASYAQGFRAPDLKELYFYFVDVNHNIRGNEDLKAEYSHNYTLNVAHKKRIEQQLLQFDYGVFYNDIRNMITLAQVEGAEYTHVNVGSFRSKGIQANTAYMWQHLKMSVGASYTGRYNLVSETSDIRPYNYTPELRANATYEWKKTGLVVAVFYKYQGKLLGFRLQNEEVRQTFIDPYHLTDLTVSKRFLKEKIQLAIGCKNLMNIRSVNAMMLGGAHSAGGNDVPIATGRVLFLKIDYTFKQQ